MTFSVSSAVAADTTIISISVSVPVLSEQMRATEPSVSTAGKRRTIALRAAIRWTPIASVMVMRAGKPSGIIDTAMPVTGLEHFDERNVADEMPEGEGDRADDQNDHRDRIAELLDLSSSGVSSALTPASS